MHKALWFSLLLACAGLAPAWAAPESEAAVAVQRAGGDEFVVGGTVTLNQAVAGDLIVAGGTVDVDSTVRGDLLALGGKLRVGADVGQSVYAASGQLTLHGKVGRNVRVAGGQVELGPKSEVAGNVSVAGGQVRLNGSVRGHVQAAGGRLWIDGPVAGDVSAASGQLELGPNARIAGKLRYRSRESLVQHPAAQVAGGIEMQASMPGSSDSEVMDREHRSPRHSPSHAWGMGWFGGLWTLGLWLIATLWLLALPQFSATVARTLQQRPGASLLWGLAAFIGVPLVAMLAIVTVIGLPLGLLGLALFAALLPLAYACAAIALGDWALQRVRPAAAGKPGARIVATALALLVLALLGAVPVLGSLIAGAALLAGLGSWVLQVLQERRARAAA